MRYMRLFVYACVPILMLFGGCNGGSKDMTAQGPTQLDLTIAPNPTHVGSPVAFTVSAFNDHLALRTVRIDYDGDGTWDETRAIDRSSATETFNHSYGAPNTYSVRAEVADANGDPVGTTLPVVVNNATTSDITYKMYGSSQKGGDCGAIGPPATCPNCSGVLLGTYSSTGVMRSFGTYPAGSHVRISQNFAQEPYVNGRLTYACQFQLLVFAKTQDAETHQIGFGNCTTTSNSPSNLTCNIDVNALVD